MLFKCEYIHTMTLVLSYMIIYNLTSLLLFSTVLQVINTKMKTLYSFSTLGSSSIFAKLLGLAILSLAGVPPLWGFFAKIFVFVLLADANLFILFPPFFTLLLTGLYFYVQNLRFLNATGPSSLTYSSETSTRLQIIYFTIALPLAFLIIFGFCYIDDLLIISS